MKKCRFVRNTLILVLCTYLNFFPAIAQARSFAEIKKSGVLRVAVDGNTPGFNYYQKGVLTGFEVDLAQAIANKLNLKVEWTVQPFNTLLIGITQDRFDLIADSHTITPQRSKIVDFITPHYCSGAYIISKKGGPQTAKDLTGKVVSVAVGTVYYDKLTTIPNIKKILSLPSESAALVALVNDHADAWVTQKSIAKSAIDSLPQQIPIDFGDIILQQTNAMVVAKGNSELQNEVNKVLAELMQDGTYAKLMAQYFDENICCK